MRQLQGYLAGSARRQDTAEDHRSPPQRILRTRGHPAGGIECFPPEPFNHRYDVRDSSVTGVGAEELISVICSQAYDSVDRTFLWRVLARFGVPQKMVSAINQFHDGMRACVRFDRVCSGRFTVEQGLRQGCVLALLLFIIFFAAVINVTFTRFKADKDIMDALMHLTKKGGGGAGGGREQPVESQSWRRRFGACFTLTMPESSRNHPNSRGR